MSDPINRGTLFDPVLVKDLINRVKGKSALAALSGQEPIPFNGQKEFTFTMDDEVDLVAEGGSKSRGSAALTPVTIVPLKIEYGARISDEFMIAAEEEQIEFLKAFNEGFSAKCARGIDLMAFHGINPRTNKAATLIGTNCFDQKVTQTVENADNTTADDKIEAAIAAVTGNEEEVSGLAMAPALRSSLAAMTLTSGQKKYPELAWGSVPGVINGLPVQVNSTVGKVIKDNSNNDVLTDLGVVGDFRNYFKWGYAKEIPMKIIEYGDPDNSGRDLQGHNEIYVRCEAYVGWGILVPTADPVTLGSLTVSSAAGTNVGDTKITITEQKGTGNSYKYKVAAAAQEVTLNMDVSGWTSWNGTDDITAQSGKVITIAEANSAGAARKAGHATVTARTE